MSRDSKHVVRCLKKANKELEECKKLGKRPKHRGLLKIEFNKDEAKKHLSTAEENLKLALHLEKEKFGPAAISPLFYCFYHCFLAIAARFGYESGNQTCTISLIQYLKEEGKIEMDEKFIEMMKYEDEQKGSGYPSLIEMREEYTYGAKVSVEKQILENLTNLCKELVHNVKEIVYN